MSYPQGYPQQQPQGYPQQSGGYPSGYPAPTGGGSNPVTAILAAVLALAAVVSLVVLDVHFLNDEIPDRLSFGDLPGAFKTTVILRFVAALVLLVGIVLVLVRKLA